MPSSGKTTIEVAGQRRAHKSDLVSPLIHCFQNLTANVIVVLEDSGCDRNRRGPAVIAYQSESLLGHQGDPQNLQWTQVAWLRDPYIDVPTGEDPVTHPAASQLDQ